jgi:hypothetical protein
LLALALVEGMLAEFGTERRGKSRRKTTRVKGEKGEEGKRKRVKGKG